MPISITNTSSPSPEIIFTDDLAGAQVRVVKGLGSCTIWWVTVDCSQVLSDMYLKLFNSNSGITPGISVPTAIIFAPSRQITTQIFGTAAAPGLALGGVGGFAGCTVFLVNTGSISGTQGPSGSPITIPGNKDGSSSDLVFANTVKVIISHD